MFLAVLYSVTGIYLLLMSFHVLHKSVVSTWNKPRRNGLRIMGAGLVILGFYYGYMFYYSQTPEGRAHQELQQRLNRQYMESRQGR